MARKKVVHLIRTLEVGGCEMALLRMLPLTNDTFEHIIVTLEDQGILAERFKNEHITVIALMQRNLLDAWSYVRLRHIIKDISPDLIITHLLHADIVGRLYVQYIVRCNVISSIVTTYNFKGYWAARVFERLTKGIAKGYMANSSSVKETYVTRFHVREHKITVVPRGIDIDSFSNINNAQPLQKELGISPSDFVIICVANLHPNKGHRYLFTAFEMLFMTHPHSKLLIVGTGREKENLLSQISDYQSKNAILFLGKRDDVANLLQISHVFALPTFFEGMSNAIMEAMASGLPIVTTNIPENKELVTHNKTGFLCPPGDSVCLTKMIEQLMGDKSVAYSLGKNGNEEMRERYNLQTTSNLWKSYFTLMSQ